MRPLLVPCVLALLLHCTPPPRSPLPPRTRVPPGCEVDLSGRYVQPSRPELQYVGHDDGGTLVLDLERASPDGGAGKLDPLAPQVVLRRTAGGFVGEVRARAFPAGGEGCVVSFPTEVLACPDGGLLVRSAETTSVDEACELADAGVPAPLGEHLLWRAPPPALASRDAGR